MVVTIPLGRKRRLHLGVARSGGFRLLWMERRDAEMQIPGDWTDEEPGAGVREPRTPSPQAGGGSIALPPDGL